MTAARISRHLAAALCCCNFFGTGIVTSSHSAENVFRMNTIRYFTSAYVDENGTNIFVNNRTTQITP